MRTFTCKIVVDIARLLQKLTSGLIKPRQIYLVFILNVVNPLLHHKIDDPAIWGKRSESFSFNSLCFSHFHNLGTGSRKYTSRLTVHSGNFMSLNFSSYRFVCFGTMPTKSSPEKVTKEIANEITSVDA